MSQFPHLLRHAFGEVTGYHAGCQEFDRCSTRGGSWGRYITFAAPKQVHKTEHFLGLKPRVKKKFKEKNFCFTQLSNNKSRTYGASQLSESNTVRCAKILAKGAKEGGRSLS